MGLILGSTILTLFEFGDFLVVALWKILRKNNRVKGGDEANIIPEKNHLDSGFNRETKSTYHGEQAI